MFDLMQKGGPIMYPLILCSMLAMAIIIERAYFIFKARINTNKFVDEIINLIKRNKVMEAVELCEKTYGPIASIIKSGIIKHNRPRDEIKEAIQTAALYEIPRLEKNIPVLSTIAYIAPLLGLLGTVTGMAKCFQMIQIKAQAAAPLGLGDLAGGIWEALIATIVGLLVAIPAAIAYNYFTTRVGRFISEMERSSAEVIEILLQKEKGYEV